MKLIAYIAQSADTDGSFGKKVNLSRVQINNIKHGRAKPSFDTMRRIMDATKGDVTPADFFTVVK